MAEETTPKPRDAYALRGKNVGCSVKLRGRVVLIAFLVNDGVSKWTPEAEKEFVSCLRQITERLMQDSGLNREQLDIAYAYCQVTVPFSAERRNSSRFVESVLRQFDFEGEDVQAYQRHYEAKFNRDETSVAFVLNKPLRSYAVSVDGAAVTEEEDPTGSEYSIVSFDPNDPAGSQRTFIHELMHQFGAIDYYYPPRLKMEAEHYFPGSIMNSGDTIDELTRYVIGWDEQLSPQAQAFLDAIETITPAEIESARRAQWQG